MTLNYKRFIIKHLSKTISGNCKRTQQNTEPKTRIHIKKYAMYDMSLNTQLIFNQNKNNTNTITVPKKNN